MEKNVIISLLLLMIIILFLFFIFMIKIWILFIPWCICSGVLASIMEEILKS